MYFLLVSQPLLLDDLSFLLSAQPLLAAVLPLLLSVLQPFLLAILPYLLVDLLYLCCSVHSRCPPSVALAVLPLLLSVQPFSARYPTLSAHFSCTVFPACCPDSSACWFKAGSLKMNTALEYSTRVAQEGGRRCKKSTFDDLVHLTPLRIPLMNPPLCSVHSRCPPSVARCATSTTFCTAAFSARHPSLPAHCQCFSCLLSRLFC